MNFLKNSQALSQIVNFSWTTEVWSRALRTFFSFLLSADGGVLFSISCSSKPFHSFLLQSHTHPWQTFVARMDAVIKEVALWHVFFSEEREEKEETGFHCLRHSTPGSFSLRTHFQKNTCFPSEASLVFSCTSSLGCCVLSLLLCTWPPLAPPLPHLDLEGESGMSWSWVDIQGAWVLLCELLKKHEQLESNELLLLEHCP